ncbi:hypothetical protein D9M68_913080 [compost metagenome]
MLRAEGGRELHVGQGGERIERMGEVAGDRGGVGEQGDPSAGQWCAQGGVFQKTFDAEFHAEVSGGVDGCGGEWWQIEHMR